jgi:hypothetical protein
VKRYPALEIAWAPPRSQDRADEILAGLDGLSMTAVEDTANGLRVFFADAAARDAALQSAGYFEGLTLDSIDVPDDDWAARSQASIDAVTVGDLIVAPPWKAEATAGEARRVIVIQP